MPEASSDRSVNKLITSAASVGIETEKRPQSASAVDERQSSTLIEFPGAMAVPEWRKQLSQRVREVQERRAREAAEAAALAQDAEAVSCALPSAQLELVPDREQPVMNPIVSKALERLDRARRTESAADLTITEQKAPANEAEDAAIRKSKLVVVPSNPETNKPRRPARLIAGGGKDPALSYLETCLSLPVIATKPHYDQAGLMRRAVAGIFDLLTVALMVSPIAAGIEFNQHNWHDPRVVGLISALAIVTLLAYLITSIALTGRTLWMRLLSLRTIDVRTGLIPTGGQAAKRAFAYIFSLVCFGLGLVYALIDSEGRTIHDRFSQTMVVRA